MLSQPRAFYRAMAGAMAFGWTLYVVSGGFPEAARLGIAKVVPVLLSVIAVWAAVVDEEAILWTMALFLVAFGVGMNRLGALPVTWAGVGLLLVIAVSKLGEGPTDGGGSPGR